MTANRCTVTNIIGLRCLLAADHRELQHDYASREQEVAIERDEARAELAALREAVAKEGGAASFFLAAWKDANTIVAELRVELERERARTAGMLGASPVTAAPARDVVLAAVRGALAHHYVSVSTTRAWILEDIAFRVADQLGARP